MKTETEPKWEERPWGRYMTVSEGDGFKVKVIEVAPGMRLSYQSHDHRDERWVIIDGSALTTIDDVVIKGKRGDIVIIERNQKHRVWNNGNDILKFVEVQMGDYLEEDDIVRYEDDFGRS
ncbi:MAG: phosphomannose isomerase type II C-terminal cupin domain [Thermoplasmatota archaeon]